METRIAAVLLLFVLGSPALRAQTDGRSTPGAEESVDSNDSAAPTETVTTSTSTTTVTVQPTNGFHAPKPPEWMHLVRLAAVAGPFAFLGLAWLIGGIVHVRLIRREQEQFPVLRGTRAPQWMPMITSALLFFVPAVLFVIFEVRSRFELRRGIDGVVSEWRPVTRDAWLMLVICLVLALTPWLFARRADTVS